MLLTTLQNSRVLKCNERYSDVRSYTQRNCNLECQSNYTFQRCSCIPYFLPKNASVKSCGKSVQVCVNKAKSDIEMTTNNIGQTCNCLPGCFEMNYIDTNTYATLTHSASNWAINVSEKYLLENMAVALFFFPQSKLSKLLKTELYGFTEILSNIGGLLGLCMGFSFLSIVEIFYFVTIRIICNRIKKFRKNGKKNQLFTGSTYPFMK